MSEDVEKLRCRIAQVPLYIKTQIVQNFTEEHYNRKVVLQYYLKHYFMYLFNFS